MSVSVTPPIEVVGPPESPPVGDSAPQTTGRFRGTTAAVFAIAFLVMHLSIVIYSWPAPLERRAVHIGMGFAILFLLLPTRISRLPRLSVAIDTVFVSILLVHSWFFITVGGELSARVGLIEQREVWLGIAVIALTIEATRRTIGWGLVVLTLLVLSYGIFGENIPGQWGHAGFSADRLVGHMYLGFNGLLGSATSASVEFIYLFLILAAALSVMGASQTLGDIAMSLFGKVRGGPAKVSVVASGLFGMVSGSAAANTASVGPFSIPLMIRAGFKPRVAASIEAVSSVGSQFVPPVMGASAFIMAEFLGVPFSNIVLAAILPAFAYYLAAFFMVDFHAAKNGLGGVSVDEVKEVKRNALKRIYLLVPLVVVIVAISFLQYSPQRSAMFGLGSCLIIALLDPSIRRSLLKFLFNTVMEGTKIALPVIAAVAASGLIIGTMSLTGLGNKLSALILDVAGDSLLTLLLLVMVAAIVLGAGLPTVPTYIVLATLLAPAMISFGVEPLAAHFFIFYFGVLADLTPPTAVSAVIAAGIAKTDPWRTMFTATKVGLFGYFIPFLFVYHPVLMLQGDFEVGAFFVASLSVLVSVVGLAAILEGWCLVRLAVAPRVATVGVVIVALLGTGPQTALAGGVLGLIVFATWLLTSRPSSGPAWLRPIMVAALPIEAERGAETVDVT